MAPTIARRVLFLIENEDDANGFLGLGEEDIGSFTELRLTIDGANWTDLQDDLFAMALRSYAPFSHNLKHLRIIIKGSVLFTQFNYIKPAISTMVPFSGSAGKSASKSRGSGSSAHTIKYRKKTVAQDKVALHTTGQKAIVTALFSLTKSIPRITIRGPMEIALRRLLITTLNPDGWDSSYHCKTQMGYASTDVEFVELVEKKECEIMSTGAEMVRLQDPCADEDDFDVVTGSLARVGCGILTGRAGRRVYGWEATALTWNGPRRNGRRSFS